MIRVHVLCEGQTEEMFVKEVLQPFFIAKEICLLPSLIGKPGHKGGNIKFERLLTDIRIRLLGENRAYCTTFFDFYGLDEGFPGKKEANAKKIISDKANQLKDSLIARLKEELGEKPLQRFIPYVQMYEFEGLLFSDTASLAKAIDKINLQLEFYTIRKIFDSPEDINNSVLTAPSKRIIHLFPEYDKVIHGTLSAIEIGLNVIRHECKLFNQWLEAIEDLKH